MRNHGTGHHGTGDRCPGHCFPGPRYPLVWGGVAGWLILLGSLPGMAQVTGLNGTVVTTVAPSRPLDNTVLEITGGQLSGSGTNLFHSFQDFNLGRNFTADFRSSGAIANIFARVIGGNASYIDGILKVSNGTSNLFFINPAGILTGVNARIEVPGSLTLTTSDRLGFAGGWLEVLGNPDFSALEGAPTQFQFSLPQAGAIVNEGDISVGQGPNYSTIPGQSLQLLGGTVLNAGSLYAPEGNVSVAAVGGAQTVNIAANGTVSFGANAGGAPPLLTLRNVPELLGARSLQVQQASRMVVGVDGKVRLEGEEVATDSGNAFISRTHYPSTRITAADITVTSANDLVLRDAEVSGNRLDFSSENNLVLRDAEIEGEQLALSANRDLTASGSSLISQGDLSLSAGTKLRIEEYSYFPYSGAPVAIKPSVNFGLGDVSLTGAQIEIQALDNSASSIWSGRDLSLSSPNPITGNARIISGRDFKVGPGQFNQTGLSLNGIISSNGNVSFEDYTGSSLKVEARGSIQGGDITVKQPGTFSVDPGNLNPDIAILNASPSVVLRAGVTTLEYPASVPQIAGGIAFTAPDILTGFPLSKPGSISIGNIETSSFYNISSNARFGIPYAGPYVGVLLDASGDIRSGNISTGGSDIQVTAKGDISVGKLDTSGGIDPVRNISRVTLRSLDGDVEAQTIDVGGGGVLIQASRSVRVLGTKFGASGGGGPLVNDPGLISYLTRPQNGGGLGYSLADVTRFQPGLGSNADVSIIARPSRTYVGVRNTGDSPLLDGYNAPVVIQYGDRKVTHADRTFPFNRYDDTGTGRILIQGDSQQAFRMGSTYPDGGSGFVMFDNSKIPAFDPINFPNLDSLFPSGRLSGGSGDFNLLEGTPLKYDSPSFPTGASGLVAGIQVGAGGNANLYGSVQVQSFDPVFQLPTQPPIQPPVVVEPPTTPPVAIQPPATPPTQPGFSANAATQDASTVAQRDPKTGQLLCPSGTPTANIALRSSPPAQPSDPSPPNPQPLQTQTDPCQKQPSKNDAIILQLLQDGPNLTGIPHLRPEDFGQPRQ